MSANNGSIVSMEATEPFPVDSVDTVLINEKKKTSTQIPMFLSKLYHLIEQCHPDVASWTDEGDGFVVKNIEPFSRKVLPKYFEHSNFSSFQRQLNYYGFRKIRHELKQLSPQKAIHFYHPKFIRGRPGLLRFITSKRVHGAKAQPSAEVSELKDEIASLKDSIHMVRQTFDRTLADMARDCNARYARLADDYNKLSKAVEAMRQTKVLAQGRKDRLLEAGFLMNQFKFAHALPQTSHLDKNYEMLLHLLKTGGDSVPSPAWSAANNPLRF